MTDKLVTVGKDRVAVILMYSACIFIFMCEVFGLELAQIVILIYPQVQSGVADGVSIEKCWGAF